MRIIHILIALGLLLAGLACLSFVSGQEIKTLAEEYVESLRGRAEKGDASAQYDLGAMYFHGPSVPQNYAEAVRWYRKSGEQGDARAQSSLGLIYQDGRGVPQDYAEAVRWYRRAAEQGITDAQYNLGSSYANGQGVPQDYVEAHMWFNLAASRASGDDQKEFGDARELVAGKMTPAQITEAQRRAREWKPTTEQESKEAIQK
jgi:TPR repeat protein